VARAKTRREARAALRTARPRPIRSAQDEQQRRLLFLVGGVILAVTAIIVGIGYYVGVVLPSQKAVLTVGEEKFTVNDIVRRARAVKNQSDTQSSTADVAQAIQSAYDLLEREAVVRQAAAEMGITATKEQIDTQLYAFAGVPLSSDREVFVQKYRELLLKSGLTDREYRRIAENQMLQQLISVQLIGEIPPMQPQARIRVLQLRSEEQAKNAVDRLNEGVTLEMLAQAAGVTGTVDRGWIIRGQEEPEVEEAAFGLAEGERSDIIRAASGGFYIVEVLEKADERRVEQSQVVTAQGSIFDRFIRDKKAQMHVSRDQSPATITSILRQVQS
jgi:parvulin-like peptidyl-prolyl isomerase